MHMSVDRYYCCVYENAKNDDMYMLFINLLYNIIAHFQSIC